MDYLNVVKNCSNSIFYSYDTIVPKDPFLLHFLTNIFYRHPPKGLYW